MWPVKPFETVTGFKGETNTNLLDFRAAHTLEQY